MSKGKYSPIVYGRNHAHTDFEYNARGEKVEWKKDSGVPYNEELHFNDYDQEGYDSYGYSAYLEDGTFVGHGQGVDRNGYTELDYLAMSDDEYNNML